MNPVVLVSLRFAVALAVWPLLGIAGSDAVRAEAPVAAVEADVPVAPVIEPLGALDIERALASESDDRPPAKLSLRKASRRVAPPRSVARSSPAASPACLTGRQIGRPIQAPSVRSVAAADLPRFCRWQL